MISLVVGCLCEGIFDTELLDKPKREKFCDRLVYVVPFLLTA